jgi:hypothetical protein
MLIKNSQWLYRIASGKTVIFLIAGFIVFMIVTLSLLPILIPASQTMVSLDDPVCYSPQEIFNILEDWGPTGRTQQLWFHMTWDIIVPVWSFLIIGTGSSWLLKRAFAPDSKWRLLNLVALTSVFDLLENFSLAGLILFYKQHLLWLAWVKNTFTMIKYGSGVLILGVFLVGFVLAVKNRFRDIKE